MIIAASRVKPRPAFYRRRVMRQVQAVVATHPGFARLVVVIPIKSGGCQAIEGEALVDPSAEPLLRELFSRILHLDAPVEDSPYAERL